MKEQIQRFGGFMAGMIIPNIGAFIAWGLITALFINTGWIPSKNLGNVGISREAATLEDARASARGLVAFVEDAQARAQDDDEDDIALMVEAVDGDALESDFEEIKAEAATFADTINNTLESAFGETDAMAAGDADEVAFGDTDWASRFNWDFLELVGPMINYLLPLLIGFTGGRMIHGTRGGVLGAIATSGVIVGSGIPMFLGGMIMGPLGGWLMKKIDDALEDHVPIGFEMLINNFTAGILGMLLAMFGMVLVGPIVESISLFFGSIVDALMTAKLLPVAAFIIEPAKVLFMNNALNHGVLTPLGAAAAEADPNGKAIHFLLETNPGPGLGLLAAYWIAGKGLMKQSAPGAAIIHFFGGIHEIYFPYVLAKPLMILSVIAGGFAADLWFTIMDAGLVASPSPGSIIAYFGVIPKGGHFQVLTGVLIGAVVSALVGSLILKVRPIRDEVEEKEPGGAYQGAVPGLSGD